MAERWNKSRRQVQYAVDQCRVVPADVVGVSHLYDQIAQQAIVAYLQRLDTQPARATVRDRLAAARKRLDDLTSQQVTQMHQEIVMYRETCSKEFYRV